VFVDARDIRQMGRRGKPEQPRAVPRWAWSPAVQWKMLTPPGPTSRPTTINTIPHSIRPRTTAKMPETTRTTATIHSKVAMKASLQGAREGLPLQCPAGPCWDLSDDWAAGAARLALLLRILLGALKPMVCHARQEGVRYSPSIGSCFTRRLPWRDAYLAVSTSGTATHGLRVRSGHELDVAVSLQRG